MNTTHKSVTQRRLRDLAPRARQVVKEQAGLHPSIAEVGMSVEPAAESFSKLYDEAVEFRTSQSREMELAKDNLAALAQELRSSIAILHHRVPGADADEMLGNVDTPERLISDGHKALTLLSQAGTPHSDAITARLKAALDTAETQWSRAQTARLALQQCQATVRNAAVTLHQEMIALRRVLRAVLGTHHLAYQTLRVSRMSPVVDDGEDTTVEDEAIEAPEAIGTASSPTVTTGVVPVSNGASNGPVNGTKTPFTPVTA